MKLLDLSRQVLVQKTESREKEEGHYEETQYLGTYEKEVAEHFGGETEIEFNKSYGAIKKIGEINKDLVKVKAMPALLDLEMESVVNRMKLFTDAAGHEATSKKLMDLGEARINALMESETKQIESAISILTGLEVKIIDGDRVIKNRADFENLDNYMVIIITSLVSGFLSKRGRIIPLPK